MRYNQQPTEPIVRDAYAIADAIVFQQEQETRQAKAIARDGIMSDKVAKLSNDIVRLQVLITDRTKAFEAAYGTTTTWKQYLDGHRHAKKVGA